MPLASGEIGTPKTCEDDQSNGRPEPCQLAQTDEQVQFDKRNGDEEEKEARKHLVWFSNGCETLAAFLGEDDLATTDVIEDLLVAIDGLAGNDGGGNAGAETLAVEGRPSAFGLEGVGCDVCSRIGVNQHEICPMAFAEKPPFLDTEEGGGGVAGFLDDGFESEDAVVPKL